MRVLIAPVGPTADEVLDCLTVWSRAALLEPFCWWPASLDGAATLEVMRVDRGEQHVELLAEALAGAEPDDVALVAFLPASAGEAVSAAFAEAADVCVALANQVLAFSLESASECAMVVAPAGVGQPVPQDLFLAQWAANVYVAPEDRRDPSDFNHLAGNAAAFPRHAAHAVACVADLWVGAGRAPLGVLATLAARQPSLAPAPVQVVRCFSRVLDYGYVVDHVAAGVFREEHAWPNPDPRTFDRIAEPNEVLPDVALSFLGKHEDVLGLSHFDPLTLDPPERLGLLAALRRLVQLVVQRIRNKPFEIVEAQVALLHDAAATRIERFSGGSVLVKRYHDSPGQARGLLALKALIDRPLYVPDGAVDKAWTDLRRLTLGLIDGGDLPPEIADHILERGALRALVTHPPRIAPNPADKPAPTEDHPDPRACDPLRSLEQHAAAVAEADAAHADAAHDATGLDGAPDPPLGDTSFLGLVGTGIAEALLEARREAAVDLEPTDEQRAAWLAAEARRRSARRSLGITAACVTAGAIGLGYLAWTGVDGLLRAPLLALIVGLWLVVCAFLARSLLNLNEASERERAQRQLDELNGAMLKAQRAGDAIRLARRYREFLDWAEILGWLVHRPWMAEPLDRIDAFGLLEPETMPAALQIGVTLQSDRHLAQLVGRGRAQMFIPGWLGSLYNGVEGLAMDELALARMIALDGGGVDRPDPAADLSEDVESPRRKLLEAVIRGDGRHLDDNPLSQDLLAMIDSMPLDGVALEVHVAKAADDNLVRALPAAVGWFDAPEDLDEIAEPLRHAVVAVQANGADWAGAVVDGRVVTVPAAVDGDVNVDVGDAAHRAMSATRAAGGLVLLERAAPAAGAAAGPDETRDDEPVAADDDADGAPAAQEEEPEIEPEPEPDVAPEPVAEHDPLPAGFELSPTAIAVGEPVLGIGRDETCWGLITVAVPGRPARVTFRSAMGPAGTPIVDLDGRLLGIQARPPAPRRGVVAPKDEADLIGVDVVRRLLAGEADLDLRVAQVHAPARRGGGSTQPTPTEFLAEPYQQAAGMALLPQHWTDNRDGHLIEEVAPEPPDLSPADADIGVLSTGAHFHEPLRVLVHRVDLTHPVTADQLTSCRAAQPDLKP